MTTPQDLPVTAPLVGVGFGPAGIALSAALTDDALHGVPGADPLLAQQAVFFERAPSSAWQPGMVLPGTDIQHHFLRDFGTPRHPGSHFGFVRFISDVGRFYPFTLRGGYVTRAEWSAYCEWAANRTESSVHYGHEVIAVEPVTEFGRLTAVEVRARCVRTGDQSTVRTQRLVLAGGQEPYVPDVFVEHLGERVFHSCAYTPRMQPLQENLRSVLVLGAGQNSGEAVLHLHATTNAEIHSVVRNSGFRLYDLGHFANQAYWPEETDYVHGLDGDSRRRIFDEQYRTNYAAVDPDVSTGLYNAWYDGEVSGRQRLHMIKRHEVIDVASDADSVTVTLLERYTGEKLRLTVDAVVLGTGFRERPVPRLLESLRPHLTVEDDGGLAVDRDFRTPLVDADDVDIYLSGLSETRHGIASSTSFSLLAVHAGDIAASLRWRARHPDPTGARP